jgi:hypothetical protein
MKEIYEIVGIAILWTSAIIGTLSLFFLLLYKAIDILSKHIKNSYIMLEFIAYYKEFKEWVKEKPRHKKHLNNKNNESNT